MSGSVFVDTNVLVYARDTTEPDKQRDAAGWIAHLWRHRSGRLSFQVLHEYYVTVTGKLDPGMTSAEARLDVRSLLAWRPTAASPERLEAAWQVQDRYGLSWWDAQVVAAAQLAGCAMLLSEDLQHGQRFGPVETVSPFEAAPGDLAR